MCVCVRVCVCVCDRKRREEKVRDNEKWFAKVTDVRHISLSPVPQSKRKTAVVLMRMRGSHDGCLLACMHVRAPAAEGERSESVCAIGDEEAFANLQGESVLHLFAPSLEWSEIHRHTHTQAHRHTHRHT